MSYFTFVDTACIIVDKDRLCSGFVVVPACIPEEDKVILSAILQDTFQIAKLFPINRYGLKADPTGWNDHASMADNNTSAFNYRSKAAVAEAYKHAGDHYSGRLRIAKRYHASSIAIRALRIPCRCLTTMEAVISSPKRTIVVDPLQHRGEERIALRLAHGAELVTIARQLGARWSRTHRTWHLPHQRATLNTVFAAYKGKAWVDYSALFKTTPAPNSVASAPVPPPITKPALTRKLEIARYSPLSIKTYLNATKQLFLYYPGKHPNDIRTGDIEAYQHHLATGKASNSYLNQVVNAVR